MSAHTPGPWKYRQCSMGGYQVGALGNAGWVAQTSWLGDDHEIECEANARLIAAATELLFCAECDAKAMEEAAHIINAINPDLAASLRTNALHTQAAIAKAQGGEACL